MKKISFLTLAEVVEIHANQIEKHGGQESIRDMNLLSSAVAMPYASYSGAFLHKDVYEMASAYAFQISQNHPFADGTKRTALVSSLVFLELNGISMSDQKGTLYDAMIGIASAKLSKEGLAEILRSLHDS